MSSKQLAAFIIVVSIITAGAVFFIVNGNRSRNPLPAMSSGNNIVTTEGKQIVEITAKGGYSPRATTAKADTPTVLKVKTNGTFDCSSALVIQSLGYRKNLPPSGETLIEVPPQKAGSILRGVCAMGMYNFEVSFS